MHKEGIYTNICTHIYVHICTHAHSYVHTKKGKPDVIPWALVFRGQEEVSLSLFINPEQERSGRLEKINSLKASGKGSDWSWTPVSWIHSTAGSNRWSPGKQSGFYSCLQAEGARHIRCCSAYLHLAGVFIKSNYGFYQVRQSFYFGSSVC